MQRSRITKYSYKPVKHLKVPTVQRQNGLLKQIRNLLARKKNAAVIQPVNFSYRSDKGVVQKNTVSHHRLGVLLASAAAIGIAASFPLDRSIASVSLDSLQQFLESNEPQEQMSRLQLRSLQETVNEIQNTTSEVSNTFNTSTNATNAALDAPVPSKVSIPLTSPEPSIQVNMAVLTKNPVQKAAQPAVSSIKEVSFKQQQVVKIVSTPASINSSSTSVKKSTFDHDGRLPIVVEQGDNLSILFQRYQLSLGDLQRILQLGKQVRALKRLKIGQKLFIRADSNGNVLDIQLELPNTHKRLHIAFVSEENNFIVVTRKPKKVSTQVAQAPVEVVKLKATSTVEKSHHKAPKQALKARTELVNLTVSRSGKLQRLAKQLELHEDLSDELKTIFKPVLDLDEHSLVAGDQIRILFDAYFDEDEIVKVKYVLAAEIRHKHKPYRAIRYTDAQHRTHYYTPEGHGLFPALSDEPVKGVRITSDFSLARRHPVLGTVRPHLGVDYGAASGTPIYATADGVIAYKGWRGGYGRTLKIEHAQKYETLYAHMSKYAKDWQEGDRVSQGQVIGYVGRSGLASSSHLHYEVLVDGEHRNPLNVKLPQAQRIDVAKNTDFIKKSKALLAQLIPSTQVAQVSNAKNTALTEATP